MGGKIYTRTGDDGTTSLGGGQRVAKESARLEAYGTVDELNAVLGRVLAEGAAPEVTAALVRIQHDLFVLGSDLSFFPADKARFNVPGVETAHVAALEADIDRLTAPLPPLRTFILPGGTPAAAQLHIARTVCRRAERRVADLATQEPVGAPALAYLNRLSDLLFVMARYENHRQGQADVPWQPGSRP